jgi:hypothetical protein
MPHSTGSNKVRDLRCQDQIVVTARQRLAAVAARALLLR